MSDKSKTDSPSLKEAAETKRDPSSLPRFLIIDSNSVIHRAFHALPRLTTKKGEPTNAAYGFLLVFLKAIKDFHPDYIAAAFDLPFPTFRHKKFKEYKAKRPPTPEELSVQIPRIKEILRSFNVPVFEKKGFEADDLLATIARKSKIPVCPEGPLAGGRIPKLETKKELEVIIVSGDLDTLQLVDKNTKVYFLRKGVKDTVLYDENLVRKKFQGLSPDQILDFKALRGDPSDNIPGVAGIGEKTATALLLEFGGIDNIYRELEKGSEKIKNLSPKIKENLLKEKEKAFLSKFLARIDERVSLSFSLKKCDWKNYNKEKMFSLFRELEFYSLINRLLEEGDKEKLCQSNEKEKTLTLW